VVLGVLDRVASALAALVIFLLLAVQLSVALRAGHFTPFSLLEESAYTFISANNFLNFGFLNSGFLQDFATSPHPADHPYVYNHMPAGPDVTNAALLWLTGGSYPLTRIIFTLSAVAGFVVYYLFGQMFLRRFDLPGAGLLLLFIGGWILIQMMERQIYSPFALLTFLPMYLYMRFLNDGRRWKFFLALAIILLSSLYLEYSVLSGIAACWGMFFLTQLVPMRLTHIIVIALTFAAGIALHLIQNMLFLGWPTFVTELSYTLSNRTTGFPTQEELASFYRSIGVVHHGSRPIEPGVLKAQIAANFAFPGRQGILAAFFFAFVALAGAVLLKQGIDRKPIQTGFLKCDIWLFVRIFAWAAGTVLTPIALFPAFAQEVTLRGSGASLFFLAIAIAGTVAYSVRIFLCLGFRTAEILKSPGVAAAQLPVPVRTTPGPALQRLVGIFLVYLGTIAGCVFLFVAAKQYAKNWHGELTTIYQHAINARMWQPLEAISRFQHQFFMTNINIPTVGFLANAPGYGVCNPEAIGRDGSLDIKHCKSALMRRHDYWAAQRPALFYYFDDPRLFPGFADCVPASTLIGTDRRGPACMTDLLDRLSTQYQQILENPFVRIFDLNRPRN
jgi:hypothetical protein